ncbi:MAG: histidinol-phosphate aminotransferase family protein [Gemmatimonadetes bacterium]|nr:histidinol-phosphate aminotransferase family protein [Gemmatimonadota bacterium]NNM05294.1 histidinol-phosphate aminotransferase family protein [Gemmatimonadota bacterium]
MTPFPREDYRLLRPYDPGRIPAPVDLSDNTNLWGAHPAALEVVRKAPPEALSRYPSVYASALKEAVAGKFGITAENVVTGCGSDDLLDSVFRAATLPPGRMSFPSPSFSMVKIFARMNGLESSPVDWQKAEVDPGRLLLDEPDLVYICRPNNPTGLSLNSDWLLGLLALGGSDGPLVILDEAYADFSQDSFLQQAPSWDRLLVLRTFSKLYGLAGLRVGYAVGPEALVREVEKSRGPYKVGQVSERAAAAALEDHSGWALSKRDEALENRDRLARELGKRGLRPLPSEANFLLIPTEPAGAVEVNNALRDRGVSGRPFRGLPGIGDALRVTIGPWHMMQRFLDALDELFETPQSRNPGS